MSEKIFDEALVLSFDGKDPDLSIFIILFQKIFSENNLDYNAFLYNLSETEELKEYANPANTISAFYNIWKHNNKKFTEKDIQGIKAIYSSIMKQNKVYKKTLIVYSIS